MSLESVTRSYRDGGTHRYPHKRPAPSSYLDPLTDEVRGRITMHSGRKKAVALMSTLDPGQRAAIGGSVRCEDLKYRLITPREFRKEFGGKHGIVCLKNAVVEVGENMRNFRGLRYLRKPDEIPKSDPNIVPIRQCTYYIPYNPNEKYTDVITRLYSEAVEIYDPMKIRHVYVLDSIDPVNKNYNSVIVYGNIVHDSAIANLIPSRSMAVYPAMSNEYIGPIVARLVESHTGVKTRLSIDTDNPDQHKDPYVIPKDYGYKYVEAYTPVSEMVYPVYKAIYEGLLNEDNHAAKTFRPYYATPKYLKGGPYGMGNLMEMSGYLRGKKVIGKMRPLLEYLVSKPYIYSLTKTKKDDDWIANGIRESTLDKVSSLLLLELGNPMSYFGHLNPMVHVDFMDPSKGFFLFSDNV